MSGATSVVQSFRERPPVAALAGEVVCVWVQEVAPGSAAYAHRTVPNGSAELVWTAGSPLRVVGPQTAPAERVLPAGATAVGVRLRPGIAPSVFGVPASELVDLDVAAAESWGVSVEALDERLAETDTPAKAARILEGAVAARLGDGPDPDPIATEAARRLSGGRATEVHLLAAGLFISERQLRRRCEAAIGFAPKVLQRMLRFQRFLALAATVEYPSDHLAHLAHRAGYADQSHLTREATRLEGRSPRTLLLEAEEHCRCSHDHAASYEPLLRAG